MYAAETCPIPLVLADGKRLAAFEMRRMERLSWKDKADKVTNRDVLQRVNETRNILDTIW